MLADALFKQGDPVQALVYYDRAVKGRPDDPKLLTNYGAVLMGLNRPSEAEALLYTATRAEPKLPQPYINLGGCLNAQGKTREAIACYRQGLELADDDAVLESNYLLTRHYLPEQEPAESLSEHRNWMRRHAGNRGEFRWPDENGHERRDKLRIGYVSPDFRTHSVAYFLGPLLANHDKDGFEIYCYSDVVQPDPVTVRMRGYASHWRDTGSSGDAELARHIHRDGIDILVDLAGHTVGNRLKVFTQKPAPVQVTWLGYPDTTGLDMIDYRITDSIADPAGFEAFYAEKLIRLPDCFLCYEPPRDAPEVVSTPAGKNGFVTFGSFNNLAKINDRVIESWSEILHRAPTARLLVKNPGLTEAVVRDRYFDKFASHGIDRERIDLKGLSTSTREHLAEYGNIDIALDTFPYNGTTTTCEALWMGVPVLSVRGNTHAGLVGASLLSAADMPEWITGTRDDYIARAAAFATDIGSIDRQRSTTRGKLARSVLCDGDKFALTFERLYQDIWKKSIEKLHT